MSSTGAARLQRGNSLGFGETPDRVTFNPAQAPLADREVLRRVSCPNTVFERVGCQEECSWLAQMNTLPCSVALGCQDQGLCSCAASAERLHQVQE